MSVALQTMVILWKEHKPQKERLMRLMKKEVTGFVMR